MTARETGAASIAEARDTHRAVGKTFWLASRLLPKEIRDDVHLLYFVLRTLDDAVDDGRGDAEVIVGGVEAWARGEAARTREALILEDLASRHPLDPTVAGDFCAGMRHDLHAAPVETEAQLDEYCYR